MPPTDAARLAREIVSDKMSKQGLNQTQAAEAWDVPQTTLSDFFKDDGEKGFRIATLERLLKAWELDPAEFFLQHPEVRARFDAEAYLTPELRQLEENLDPAEVRWIAENAVRSKHEGLFEPIAKAVTAFLDSYKTRK